MRERKPRDGMPLKQNPKETTHAEKFTRRTLYLGSHQGERLVAVMRGLIRTIDGDVEVLGLGIAQCGKLDIELSQMGASDFLI